MSLWLDSSRITWRTLRGHPLRTALVALSVALGTGGISLLVSLGKSAVGTILHGVEQVGGARLMFLSELDTEVAATTYDRGITLADIHELQRRVPGLRSISFLQSTENQAVFSGTTQADADIAIGADWLRFKKQKVLWGTSIPTEAEASDARVVVIAEALATKLFGAPQDALGGTITLWGHHYRVVGVAGGLKTPGFNMGGVKEARAVYLSPYAATKHEGVLDRGFVILESDGTVSHDLQMRLMDAVLLARHRTIDWELFDMEPLMVKFQRIFLVVQLLIALIAAVALFIAGAGIMNVLLASVRERVGEIGIRRAMGANAQDVRRQFLVESAALSLIGGISGVALGSALAWALGQLVLRFYPIWQVRISEAAAVLGLAMALVCGIGFGLMPARRAAKLDIVACLRGDA